MLVYSWSLVGYRRWSVARGSFVCNASIWSLVGYRRWSVARDSFVCNASIAGLWLGSGGGLWLRFICL